MIKLTKKQEYIDDRPVGEVNYYIEYDEWDEWECSAHHIEKKDLISLKDQLNKLNLE